MSEPEREDGTDDGGVEGDDFNATDDAELASDDASDTGGDEDAAPAPDDAPGTDATATPESMERAAAAISRSFDTYTRAIGRALEEQANDLLICPLCGPSMTPGWVNKHDLGRVPEEVVANVRMFVGDAKQASYPQAPSIGPCEVCQALGKVATGSRVPEHATIVCPNCKGYGYNPPPGASANGGNGASANVPVALDTSGDFADTDRDAWGEPKVLPDGTLNENFGKMPQFKHPHPVYGMTANLNVAEHMVRES